MNDWLDFLGGLLGWLLIVYQAILILMVRENSRLWTGQTS